MTRTYSNYYLCSCYITNPNMVGSKQIWLTLTWKSHSLLGKYGVYILNERPSYWVNMLFTRKHAVKFSRKLNLNTWTKSCIQMQLARFRFRVVSILPLARFGFGRREASFLNLWEKSLRICPKQSPAYSDGTTTIY